MRSTTIGGDPAVPVEEALHYVISLTPVDAMTPTVGMIPVEGTEILVQGTMSMEAMITVGAMITMEGMTEGMVEGMTTKDVLVFQTSLVDAGKRRKYSG